jgi:alanine-glyoxylate transaminase / serine-glyoxylate transaminase / serine-pyruvate transaminase
MVVSASSFSLRESPFVNFASIAPPVRRLMGPGPSDIHPRVLSALSQGTVGHLDPYYLRIMDEMQEMLRAVFQTRNRMTFAVSATGSAGMEAAVVNVIEPGDKMVVCVNGVFGARMADVATRAGAAVTQIERAWGDVFSPDEIEKALAATRPKVLGIVLAETSTGARQPLDDIAAIAHKHDALILVDAVTALGGLPVEVDRLKLDVVYSGSQKCLSCPPGLAPITLNDRAMQAVLGRKTKVQSWYLDVTMLAQYWGQDRVYHHTAPINMTYGLHEALRLVLEEGLEKCFARHTLNHRALKAGLAAIGIGYTSAAGHELPMLNAVQVPAGVDDARVRRRLLEEYGIEIGGGLGAYKGRVWRIGLMGYGSRPANVLLLLAALERLLADEGYSFASGASIPAANGVYRGG